MQTGTRRSTLSFQGLAGSPRQALETDGVNGSTPLSSTNFHPASHGRKVTMMRLTYTKPTGRRKPMLPKPSPVPIAPIHIVPIEELFPHHPVIDILRAWHGRRGAPVRLVGGQQ
jgi:hypothetical protein